MTSKTIYHYVYRITNTDLSKHYYGKRSSKLDPKLDLGKIYFSSSTDKNFIRDQKENPEKYKYKIVKLFESAKDACIFESKLHAKFNVGTNPKFYNLIKQTANGFDCTGKVAVKDKNNVCYLVNKDDPRYILGELLPVGTGRPCSEKQKLESKKRMTGRYVSPETRAKSSATRREKKIQVGSNNSRFKRFYITPFGKFDSPAALLPKLSLTKMKNFCMNNDRVLIKTVYDSCDLLKELYDESCIGKTYLELGFSTSDS